MKILLLQLIEPQNLLLYLFAYGLAAMPTSYWVAKIIHRYDVERDKVHSHTASYIWQRLSIGSAVLVFVLDLIKGLLPCAIASSLNAPGEVIAVTGLFAVLGHCFSVLLKFSGGHGGATFAGALLVIALPAGIITVLTNYLMIALKLKAGLASMIAALIGAIFIFFLLPSAMVWLVVIAMVVIIFVRQKLSVEP